MSFGPNNTTKAAENNLGGISGQLQQLAPTLGSLGQNQLNTGAGNVASGTNFFNTLLHGNTAQTSAALAPSINQIRSGTSNTVNGINTLMPRGGGRFGTLFGQSFAPQSQVQNLFDSARTNAASALPNIGLGQEGVGTNLFGLGNQAYGTAGGINSSLATYWANSAADEQQFGWTVG